MRLLAGVAIAALTAPLYGAFPAQASDVELVTAHETEVALANTGEGLVLTPSDDAGLGRTELGDARTVEIPREPERGVGIELDGARVSVSLPGAETAGRGVEFGDGTVAFPGVGFSNAVIAADDGVQFLATVNGPSAPTRFEYKMDIPKDATLEEIGAGRVAVVDADGVPMVVIQPAWARDASGSKVKTHYAVDGHTLVQYVHHRQKGVTYPVVADPKFEWWGGLPTVKLNRSDTYKMRYAATPAKLSLCIALGGPAGVALAVPCALSIAVLSAKAGTVYAKGKCLRVIIGPGVLGGAEYKDSYCR